MNVQSMNKWELKSVCYLYFECNKWIRLKTATFFIFFVDTSHKVTDRGAAKDTQQFIVTLCKHIKVHVWFLPWLVFPSLVWIQLWPRGR